MVILDWRFSILDSKEEHMNKTVWIGSWSGINLKSKIQNLKWLALCSWLSGEANHRGIRIVGYEDIGAKT